ncbi:MAG: FtsW/RodA/SpoVE family cell cycle protein, partial [Bacteroidota bacterium]
MSLVANIYQNLKGDRSIWIIVAVLSVFSVLTVYSASGSLAYQYRSGNTEFYLIKQIVVLAMGLGLMYICYQLNYLKYSRIAPLLLLIAVPLLLYTLFFGDAVNDARRWIQVPIIGLTFQTSDFAKLALIIYLARSISSKQDYIKDFNSAFVPLLLPVLVICGLIAPSDLSTAALLFLTCLTMMFIGRVHIYNIGVLLLFGIVLLALLIIIGQFVPELVPRLDTWTSRATDFFTNSEGDYQVRQAKIAIADGGWFGVGPGNSIQRNYLPYA